MTTRADDPFDYAIETGARPMEYRRYPMAEAYRDQLLAAETPEERLAREKRIEKIWNDWEAFALTQRKVKPYVR